MTWKVVGEIVGAVAIAESFFIYLSNKRSRIIALKFVADILWVINYFLLGGYTGAFLNVISMAREAVFSQRGKNRFCSHPAWLVVFLAGALASPILTCAGPISLLPAVGSVLSTLGFYCIKPATTRVILFASYSFWLSYSILLGDITAIISGVIAISSLLIGALLARIAKKRTKA